MPQQRRAAALAGGIVRLPAEAGDRLHDGRPHRHRRRLRLPPRVHRRVVTADRGGRIVSSLPHPLIKAIPRIRKVERCNPSWSGDAQAGWVNEICIGESIVNEGSFSYEVRANSMILLPPPQIWN